MSGKKVYKYSRLWRLIFFTIPPLAVYVSFLGAYKIEVVQEQLHVKSLLVQYDLILLILTAMLVLPYFFLLFMFFQKFIITGEGITKKNFLYSRAIAWKEIFEYRDHLCDIELVPINVKNTIRVDTYYNLEDHKQFNYELVRRCKREEANMLVKPGTRHLMPIKLDSRLIFLLFIFCGFAVMFFKIDAAFLGITAGVAYVYLSYIISLTHRNLNRRAAPSRAIHYAIYLLLLFISLCLLIQPLLGKSFLYIAALASSYFAGFWAASGLMTLLLPERKDPEEGRKIVFLAESVAGKKNAC